MLAMPSLTWRRARSAYQPSGSRVVFRTNKLEVTAPTHPVLVTAGNGLTANVTGAAIVAATTIQLNAPGDEVRVNGRKVQLI